jgi:hypothetical protein
MENDISNRVDVLESGQGQILQILQKIEKRLIGNLEEDKPGLIDDVRVLRKTMESIDTRIMNIERANLINRIQTLETEIQSLSTKVAELTKYRFMVYGGILVVAFIFNKAWDYIQKII